MGCLKGFEEREDDGCRYGRWIVRANLRKPVLDLSQQWVKEDEIESPV